MYSMPFYFLHSRFGDIKLDGSVRNFLSSEASMKRECFLILVLSISAIIAARTQDNLSTIQSIISRMSLEEKAQLVVGASRRAGSAQPSNAPVIGNSGIKVPGAAGSTATLPRLSIPEMVLADGPAGLRISPKRNDDPETYYATGFPVATLLASTWDVDLVKEVGLACGAEVHEYGADIWLAPALNIHRNPLGGRNFEYYSEDPLITGNIAAAMVTGMQTMGVGTSIKHFAANNQETSRNTIDTIVSERALREIYLKGFEIAVKKSNPWTVMSSYNKINGGYTSESPELLTSVLRNDWHYQGFVMTDWGGGRDPVAQMKAGNDLLMPGRPEQSKQIIEAVQSGALPISVLDQNVARILNILLQSPAYKNYKYSNKPDLTAHAQIARSAAAQGMVLLKNENNALPLKTAKSIALFGNASYDLIAGGTGSGDVNKAYVLSTAQGLTNAKYHLDENLKDAYENYLKQEKAKQPSNRSFFTASRQISPMPLDAGLIEISAARSDVALITISRNAGEGADRKLDGDFYLTEQEKGMMKSIADAFHAKGKKAIVVLNIGGVIEVASWRNGVDGILLAWQPGQEGGNAIADVLSGAVNPSGKLATTFPMEYADVPSAKNFPGTPIEKPQQVVYEEGIYVGYRYYNSFKVKPAYEFGYGLSYTSFDYSKLKLSASSFKDQLTASITATNSGSVAGREIVELYISAPAQKMDKPESELRAFAKTKLLQPGKSETLTFIIQASDLASFDSKDSCWTAEAGKYVVKIGSSSLNIKQSATFTLPEDKAVEKTSKALAPQTAIKEFRK
jgi:beta-glucosidase